MCGDKVIKVYDKSGCDNRYCSMQRAVSMIKKSKAEWIEDGVSIRLVWSKDDYKELKEQVMEEQSHCYICGVETIKRKNTDNSNPRLRTIDHVEPKERGGDKVSDKDNFMCCCKRCNDDKANRSLQQYVSFIKHNREKYKYLTDAKLYYLSKNFK